MTMLNIATNKISPSKSNWTTKHNTPSKDQLKSNKNRRLNLTASANSVNKQTIKPEELSMGNVIKLQYDHKHKF